MQRTQGEAGKQGLIEAGKPTTQGKPENQMLTRLSNATAALDETSESLGMRKRSSTVLLAVAGGMVHLYGFRTPYGRSVATQASCQAASSSSEYSSTSCVLLYSSQTRIAWTEAAALGGRRRGWSCRKESPPCGQHAYAIHGLHQNCCQSKSYHTYPLAPGEGISAIVNIITIDQPLNASQGVCTVNVGCHQCALAAAPALLIDPPYAIAQVAPACLQYECSATIDRGAAGRILGGQGHTSCAKEEGGPNCGVQLGAVEAVG